jgi:archaellum component FlaF (FlaF/FlaG flagellin family)
MQLITVIILLVAIWVVYQIYISYNNIVKELKQIREKCIKEGVSQQEAFVEHVSENYMSDKLKTIKNNILTTLKKQLEESN